MFTIVVVFHVLVSIGLILVVLMQSAKGEGLAGSAFGGSGLSGAVFGGRGAASFLSKATTVLAVLFMVNCAALAFMSSSTRTVGTAPSETAAESVITREAQKERERMMQQQQQQQTMPLSDSGANIQIAPGEAAQEVPSTPTDSTGN